MRIAHISADSLLHCAFNGKYEEITQKANGVMTTEWIEGFKDVLEWYFLSCTNEFYGSVEKTTDVYQRWIYLYFIYVLIYLFKSAHIKVKILENL